MPFDVKAASISARLFNKGREQREMGKEGCRNKLNADSMIIATAAAHGAQRIYSANDDFRTLAKVLTHWKVEDLPINSGKLFE